MEYQRILQDKFEHIFNYGTTYRELKTLRGIDFAGVSLHRAQRSLSGVTFEDCRFSGAEMRDTDFEGVQFISCDFRGADLRRVNFAGAILKACAFDNADFAGTDLGNLNITDSDISSCSFEGASFAGAQMSWRLYQYFGELGINLQGVELSGIELEAMDFSGANIFGLRFGIHADLKHANFERAKLENMVFDGCDLSGTRFNHAVLENCEFKNCRFSRSLTAIETLNASFQHAIIQNCNFHLGNSGLDCEQFSGANLTGSLMPQHFLHFQLPLENINRVVDFARPLFIALTLVAAILATAVLFLPQLTAYLPLFMAGSVATSGLAVMFYGYLRHLWLLMHKLPTRFPDGTGAQLASTPWLMGRIGLPNSASDEAASRASLATAAILAWGLPWGALASLPLTLLVQSGEAVFFSPVWWVGIATTLTTFIAGWTSLSRLRS